MVCTERVSSGGEVQSCLQYFAMEGLIVSELAELSWCAVHGSMLFPRIPSALSLSFVCFVLA